ncbi:hypothetical protein [Shewanella baltica]|nr:hypothetical protein [Shewanella baltica]
MVTAAGLVDRHDSLVDKTTQLPVLALPMLALPPWAMLALL